MNQKKVVAPASVGSSKENAFKRKCKERKTVKHVGSLQNKTDNDYWKWGSAI